MGWGVYAVSGGVVQMHVESDGHSGQQLHCSQQLQLGSECGSSSHTAVTALLARLCVGHKAEGFAHYSAQYSKKVFGGTTL